MKNKQIKSLFPVLLFLGALFYMYVVYDRINNFDKYHWLVLMPVVLPLAGIIFGVKMMVNLKGSEKIFELFVTLLNLLLAAYIFVAFSFSYWQF